VDSLQIYSSQAFVLYPSQPRFAPQRPTDPIAAAAYDVFDTNCSRCHQIGKLRAGKAGRGPNGELLPRGHDFGYILNLERLASDPKLPLKVVPGKPEESEIIKRIDTDEYEDKMPNDYLETREVSKEERKAIIDWIGSLGNRQVASCGTDHFISDRDILRLVATDLDALHGMQRSGTRYLSLVNLYNIAAVTPVALTG
jgi:hypothetical protein